MTLFKPPLLDKAAPIVDPITGRPSVYFQRFWMNLSFTAADGGSAGAGLSSKVDKGVSTGWSSPTGAASKATYATYVAPAISNPPTQAEVQALANATQTLSQHLKAVTDALLAAELITP